MERKLYTITITDARYHTATTTIAALNQAEALCIAAGYAFRELSGFDRLVESEVWFATIKPANKLTQQEHK